MRTTPVDLLIVIGSLRLGGTENHLAQVLPKLADQQIKIAVVTLWQGADLAEKLKHSHISLYHSYFAPKGFLFVSKISTIAKYFRLAWYFWRLKPRLISLYQPESYIVGMRVARVLGSEHLAIMNRRSLNYYQNKKTRWGLIERALHSRVAAIFCNSNAIRQQLIEEEGAEASKVEVIYNGLDFQSLDAAKAEDRQSLRRRLGVDAHAVIGLTVANLIPYKGHADLINAIYAAKTKLPPHYLHIFIGDDRGIQNELLQAARSLGVEDRIAFVGKRLNVHEYIAVSDIAVCASHEEGFSNSVIEYLAGGLPTVVTAVGGNSEAAGAGKYALMVDPKQPVQLADAMVWLLTHPNEAQAMGAAARAHARSHFSLERCVASYHLSMMRLLDRYKGI
jgi:glycosyltransferase involved in cell wall biosynthesis